MSDWDNNYEAAGPGAKRRIAAEMKALARQERPHSPERTKRTKPVRERLSVEYRDVSAIEVKSRIMALTLAGLDPRQIDEELRDERISVTLVTLSNVHRQYRETIKILRGLGLIDERRLNRYLARE